MSNLETDKETIERLKKELKECREQLTLCRKEAKTDLLPIVSPKIEHCQASMIEVIREAEEAETRKYAAARPWWKIW